MPDNTTCELEDSLYGSELVVRPDTIVYLACSIALSFKNKLKKYIPKLEINDWSDALQVLLHISTIVDTIKIISIALEKDQTPFLLQPIWKTNGKSPELAEQCLDIFVWSDAGFSNFISIIANKNSNVNKINKQTRTAIWLYKMLQDINEHGKFDHSKIIDSLSYNTKNDKAFASSGKITNVHMASTRLKISNNRQIRN